MLSHPAIELTPSHYHTLKRVAIMLEHIYRREVSPLMTVAYLTMAHQDIGRVLRNVTSDAK